MPAMPCYPVIVQLPDGGALVSTSGVNVFTNVNTFAAQTNFLAAVYMPGLVQNDALTRVVVQDSVTGRLWWRSAATLGGGGVWPGEGADFFWTGEHVHYDPVYFNASIGMSEPPALDNAATQILALNGFNTVVRRDASTLGGGGGGGYALVQEEGTGVTARTTLNFVGAGLTAADDAGNTRTNVTLAGILNTIVTQGGVAAAQILTNSIGNSELRFSSALSVLGRATNTAGEFADLSAGTDFSILRRNGATIGFGQIVGGGITDSTITYGKIQNVSATDRILGRDAAGAGVIEEMTTSQVLDFVAAGVGQGNILYRGPTVWALLPPGTSGQVLQTQGAGANPQWATVSGGSAYATVQEEGSALTQRQTLNFIGSGLTAADDLGNTRTNVTLAAILNTIVTQNGVSAAEILTNSIGNSELRQSSALSVLGRATNTAGDFADISAGTDTHILRRNGTTIGFGLIVPAGMNITATQRIVGRNTAGAGVAEEVTATQFIDWISTTQGAVLYRNATTWVALAPGTSGQVLQTQGAGANPQWATVSGGSAYATIQEEGSGLTARTTMNFIGSGLTAADDAGNTRTNITLATILNTIVTQGGVAAAQILDSAVGNAELRASSALSVLGRAVDTAGDFGDISAGTDGHILRRNGTTIGFGQIVAAGITDATITYAKIQNISATQRIVGRNTAGAGVAEEVTATQVLDWISTTQGAILYRNATTWVALAPGTSGQFLQTQGAAANPQWATGAGGGGYALVQEEGTGVTVRTTLNFVGSGLTAADDAGNTRTNVTLAGILNTIVTAGGVAAAQILNSAVGNAQLRDSSALSVLGRATDTSGQFADISAGTDGHILRRNGTTIGFGQIVAAGITDATITYAKIQNISATQRVLGRNTAGAGVTEEVTASQLLDWIGTTQGSVLYRNATTWVALAPGTSGQFLQTQGAAANPQWATASGGSSVPYLPAFTPYAAEFPATNFPQLTLNNRRPVLWFDGGATNESCYWTFKWPQGSYTTVTLYLDCVALSAITGNAIFNAYIEAITQGDAVDTDTTTSFGTVNASSATAVAGTAGYIFAVTITISNLDSVAAGDYVRMQLERNSSSASDTVTTDVGVYLAEIRFS